MDIENSTEFSENNKKKKTSQQQNGTKMSTQTYKVIGLRKKPDEPLVSVKSHVPTRKS